MKLNETSKPIFHLNLKRKWFDMVVSGEKREEYRVQSPYWGRVLSAYIKIKGKYYHPTDVILCFSNGYAKDRPQIFFECKGMRLGFGRESWGAIKGEQYFVIRIGHRISRVK